MVESEKCKRKFLLLSYGVIEQNLLQDESRFAIPHCKEHFYIITIWQSLSYGMVEKWVVANE